MTDSDRVSFSCPECGKRLRAKATAIGTRVRCPNNGCGNSVIIPDAPGTANAVNERPRSDKPSPVDVSVASMGWFSRSWARLANALAFENQSIYGRELRALRYYLRAFGLRCLQCRSRCGPSLTAIEQGIKQRRSVSGTSPFGVGAMAAWLPSWDKGSVCKHCNGILCGPCTTKRIEQDEIWGGMLPHCPRCGEMLEGIDHLTD